VILTYRKADKVEQVKILVGSFSLIRFSYPPLLYREIHCPPETPVRPSRSCGKGVGHAFFDLELEGIRYFLKAI